MATHPESPGLPDHDELVAGLRAIVDAVAASGGSSAAYDRFSDDTVLAVQGLISEARRGLETRAAWVAATVARRSAPELGGTGLAARQGFLSPEAMIQKLTGSTRGEAVKLFAVGRLLAETDAAQNELDALPPAPVPGAERPGEPDADTGDADTGDADTGQDEPGDADPGEPVPSAALPWHAPISQTLQDGRITVEKADSLRKGLGDLNAVITPEALAHALAGLLAEAETLNADQLLKRARRVRDELDADGIQGREQAVYEERFLRFWRLPDGRVRLNGLYAPEDGEYLMSAHDALVGPKRGGVRFVDTEQAAWAKRIHDDPRTPGQLVADGFLAVFKAGVDADPRTVFGGRRPAVRILTTRPAPTPTTETSTTPTQPVPDSAPAQEPAPGPGVIEGTMVAVSAATVARNLCDTGAFPLVFDDHGHGVDLGREQRLFSFDQRALLGARDGGCRWPDCDRPPSWSEAHHLLGWSDEDGPTDLALGILLCRAHHLKHHNEHWRIVLVDGDYRLRPPPGLDPEQHLIPLPRKNPPLPGTGTGYGTDGPTESASEASG